MSDIVHVQHPAPIRYIPKGMRSPRDFLVKSSTPVRLVRDSSDAFRWLTAVDGHDSTLELHERDGRIWTRLEGWGPTRLVLPGFGPKAFVDYLTGGIPQTKVQATDIHWSFYRTPLCAALDPALVDDPKQFWMGRPHTRGENFDEAEARQVLEDGREAAAAAVRRFLEENVVLTEEGVFVRVPGPLVLPHRGVGKSMDVTVFPRIMWDDGPLCRVDRAHELSDLQEEVFGKGTEQYGEALEIVARDVDPTLFGDDDVRLYVNHAIDAVLDGVGGLIWAAEAPRMRRSTLTEQLLGRSRVDPGTLDGIRELQRWQGPARRGAIPPEEDERLLALMRDVLRDVQAAYHHCARGPKAKLHELYIERIALPRVRASVPMAAGDADAIAGIAP